MTEHRPNPAGTPDAFESPVAARRLPLMLLLFIGSGCAALVYEIVWFQMLQLVVGSTAVSMGVLLGTFMGGMCLGSLLLPRLIGPRPHPLRVYAALELAIGAIGIAALYVMPLVGRVYSAEVGHGMPGLLLRGAVGAVCLLPPTLLMGATLPAVARWVETTPRGVSWLGFFYGGNIAGAVFGCLLAGFYLLRVHDVAAATYVAAAINVAVALLAMLLAAGAPRRIQAASLTPERATAARAPGAWRAYLVITLSGACALGAEVVWARLLSLLLGATVYTFSIILAVFLVGLGIGSSVGAYLSRGMPHPRRALGVCQLLLTGAIAWAAYTLTVSIPFWPIDPSLSTDPWIYLQLDMARCLWATLPAALLWGASFPLALASVAAPGQDPGRLVGGVYAANTLGAIVGSVGMSLALQPLAGSMRAQQTLIGVAAVAAALALAPLLRPFRAVRLLGAAAVAAAMILLAAPLARGLSSVPPLLVAYGRYAVTWVGQADILYVGEGMNAPVAVSRTTSGNLSFHVAGKVEASSEWQDMRLQRMLAHTAALVHPDPKSVLVVGCGAGVTAGSFVPYPGIEKIVICEIEPLIPKVISRYFDKENNGVIQDDRVKVIYDDGRHYVLTTDETFDIITSDPIHPWVKGSATLYTREYFEMVRERLNPGGVVTQWVPLYESNEATVKSEIATFFEVFPEGTIWSNDDYGKGYDVVLLGQAGPASVNIDAMENRLRGAGYEKVAQSLNDVGFSGATALFGTYGGRARDLRPWLEGAEINTDRNIRLQYMAGLNLNYYEGESIYNKIREYRTFPTDLFIASYDYEQQLWEAIELGTLDSNE